MNSIFKKHVLPHIIAFFVFLSISLAYFYPLLQNKTIFQSDMVNVEGMAKELNDHTAKTGRHAQWTNSMFGGMPAYQIQPAPSSNIYYHVGQMLQKPFSYTTMAIILITLISFYILLFVMKFNTWLSIIGAFIYAFCSYNFIIIEAGHVTKAYAIGTIPLVVAGFIHIYNNKEYLSGGLLLAFGLGINIAQSHFQITYYAVILLFIYVLIEAIHYIIEKNFKHFIKASAMVGLAVILAVLPNVYEIYKTYDYGKESTRGPSELTLDNSRNTQGLDKDYAFSWSYGKMESFTLLIPNFYGASSHYDLGKNSHLYKEMRSKGVPEGNARDAATNVPTYWGAQPFTSGPVYLGAIAMFLFVFGLVFIKHRHKWWLLIAAALGLMLSWGDNFMAFNNFVFDYLPGYHKFRTVSMILVIPSFAVALLAIMGLKELLNKDLDLKRAKQALLIALGSTAGLSLLFALLGGGMFNFVGSSDKAMLQNGFPQWYIEALVADRISMFKMDALRSAIFISLSFAAIWFYANNKLKINHLLIALSILIVSDMWSVNKRFLNNDDFVSKRRTSINATENDMMISQDTDLSYRVFNAAGNPFNDARTSYFHKSIGGYHGAKMRRYQELVERHFSGGINTKVLNMLNTRYFISPSEDGRAVVQRNMYALGNAWFVENVNLVNNADEEIVAVGNFDPENEAIIDKRFEEYLADWSGTRDSTSSIKLVSYEPDKLVYQVDAKQNELAVFSEIYYPKYWDIKIDGKDAEMMRANYVLRAMVIPKGSKEIVFEFIPTSWNLANKVALWSSILVILLLISHISFSILKRKERKKLK